MLAHTYNIITNSSFGAPGHGEEIIYGLNTTYKSFIYMLISTVQLSSSKNHDKQMAMHISTVKVLQGNYKTPV